MVDENMNKYLNNWTQRTKEMYSVFEQIVHKMIIESLTPEDYRKFFDDYLLQYNVDQAKYYKYFPYNSSENLLYKKYVLNNRIEVASD